MPTTDQLTQAAKILVEELRSKAAAFAILYAEALRRERDYRGAEIWMRIVEAIGSLEGHERPAGETLH